MLRSLPQQIQHSWLFCDGFGGKMRAQTRVAPADN